MVLMIDNFDSFTYNLVHYLEELDATVRVFRNNELTVADVEKLAPAHIVISPGPGRPHQAGCSRELIAAYAGKIPILGVCLGLQCMGAVYGGSIVRSERILHGKTSLIHHYGTGLFAGIKTPFRATRYHSLILARDAHKDNHITPQTEVFPSISSTEAIAGFAITAWNDRNEIMGISHKKYPALCGVQFHPESIASEHGHALLQNFLVLSCAGESSEANKVG